MKRRILSAVNTEPQSTQQTSLRMKQICEGYRSSSVKDVTIREMCALPSVFVGLEVDGELCSVIFTLLRDGRLDVESIPPRVKSVKGIDGVAKLSELYDNFASVVQGLWAQLFDALDIRQFKEVQ